mmetsp:Transcript_62943/g.150066  ORF Transcript_62943/g.150066 Transcript_62943/m.150066 type:complete len:310 (+) Transcript_62943:392-1321(+)
MRRGKVAAREDELPLALGGGPGDKPLRGEGRDARGREVGEHVRGQPAAHDDVDRATHEDRHGTSPSGASGASGGPPGAPPSGGDRGVGRRVAAHSVGAVDHCGDFERVVEHAHEVDCGGARRVEPVHPDPQGEPALVRPGRRVHRGDVAGAAHVDERRDQRVGPGRVRQPLRYAVPHLVGGAVAPREVKHPRVVPQRHVRQRRNVPHQLSPLCGVLQGSEVACQLQHPSSGALRNGRLEVGAAGAVPQESRCVAGVGAHSRSRRRVGRVRAVAPAQQEDRLASQLKLDDESRALRRDLGEPAAPQRQVA